MGFQLKHTFCSKIFTTGPSELGNVMCQIENQTKSRKNKGGYILQARTLRKTEPNLKLYSDVPKVYPQVKFIGFTFDSQLTFKKHFEDILDAACNTRYHRLRLLANKMWGPSPFTLIQIYKQCVQPIFEYGSISTIIT